jgi:methylglyoxal synthase
MVSMPAKKRVALVAHDRKKPAIAAWAKANRDVLAQCDLWGTGTTGALVARETGLKVTLLKSGPLGGDLQLGAVIAEGQLDILIFFTDPLTAMPHDVKALVRIATLNETVFACNEATADFVIASRLFHELYENPRHG